MKTESPRIVKNFVIIIQFFAAIFIFNATFARAQSGVKLEVGAKVPRKYVGDGSSLLATSASQLRPYIKKTIHKVDYLIAYEKGTRKISYIFTDDDFRNSEGMRVGNEITVLWKQIEILGYFQLRGPAGKDGWQPVIGGFTAFEGDYLEKAETVGKITTRIEGFVKGYN